MLHYFQPVYLYSVGLMNMVVHHLRRRRNGSIVASIQSTCLPLCTGINTITQSRKIQSPMLKALAMLLRERAFQVRPRGKRNVCYDDKLCIAAFAT